MKTQLLVSVAVVALLAASAARAADLPLKAPAPAAPSWTWSGFYAGGHGGCAWGHDSTTTINDPFFSGKYPTFVDPSFNPKGCLGGFQAGANWQTGRVVSGLEIDLSAGDIKGSASGSPAPINQAFATTTGSMTSSSHFDWLGSARARLGYLATPDLLLYGTGGLAWSRYETSTSQVTTDFFTPAVGGGFANQSSLISAPSWRFGWVAGVGGEYRLFNSNWLARLEYLHYDFGNSGSYSGTATFAALPPAVASIRTSGDLTVDVVRAGLSYKFDPDRFALGFAGDVGPAAGLSYKAPPPAAVAWNWSGLYLGAHAGYGWGRDPFSNRGLVDIFGNAIGPAGFALNGVSSEGYVGGFQAGANWQSRSVVGGLELDISSTGIKGSSTITSPAGGVTTQATQTDKFDPLGSVRTRIGYLVTPDMLLYGTGGLGWTRLQSSQVSTVTGAAPNISEVPTWLFGWVAGVGVETRLGNTNWLGRLEYLHYDFGDSGGVTSFTAAGVLIPGASSSGHLTVDVVRAGASYKFDWPGMVPAASAYNAYAAMPGSVPAEVAWSWSGFYLGGHAGYGWGQNPSGTSVPWNEILENDLLPPVTVGGPHAQGFVGGFQAGGNWQYNRVVGGLEIDLSDSEQKGSSSASGIDAFGQPLIGMRTDQFDLLGSARARLGYLVTPDLWLYGTGGLGWTRFVETTDFTNGGGTTITATPSWRFGWVAGIGGEYRLFNSNWLVRLEYLHYDFGDSGSNFQGFNSTEFGVEVDTLNTSRHLTNDILRTGIDYKFD